MINIFYFSVVVLCVIAGLVYTSDVSYSNTEDIIPDILALKLFLFHHKEKKGEFGGMNGPSRVCTI